MDEEWRDLAADGAVLEAILDAFPELVFVLDAEGRYLAVLGGRDEQRYHDGRSLIGRRMHDVLPEEIADGFLATVHEALETGRVATCQYELARADVDGVGPREGVPDSLWFEGRVSALRRGEGHDDLVVWMLFNVTDLRTALVQLEAQQEVLQRLATTDPLTGLLNRRQFFELAGKELGWVKRTGATAALLSLDLDHFKKVNDTCGHGVGDLVLAGVADVLRAGRRATDLVARLGGEEFALLLRGISAEEGLAVAERLRQGLAGLEVSMPAELLPVRASIGVTELRRGDALEDALRRADAAMYEAKAAGRDQVRATATG